MTSMTPNSWVKDYKGNDTYEQVLPWVGWGDEREELNKKSEQGEQHSTAHAHLVVISFCFHSGWDSCQTLFFLVSLEMQRMAGMDTA